MIRRLINRLARLDSGEGWSGELNPAQRSALEFLACANRFSRSPSHVADYLGTTRGTMSQTLKTLQKKGYVHEEVSLADKRVKSYSLTPEGKKEAGNLSRLSDALKTLSEPDLHQFEHSLTQLLNRSVSVAGNKPFGLCRDCRHFRPRNSAGFCALLAEKLTAEETGQICYEQHPLN